MVIVSNFIVALITLTNARNKYLVDSFFKKLQTRIFTNRSTSNLNPIFKPGTPERKVFLKELNAMAKYTGDVLHGEELTSARERQLRKYFHKTYKMLHRIAEQKELNNNSFKFGYGGKALARKVLLQFGVIDKIESTDRKVHYQLQIPIEEIDLELVSRIIVEVYLIRNDIREL